MKRRLNFGKILITLFLTVLIWVWADLALDDQYTVSNARVSVAKRLSPGLWVSFAGQATVPLKKLVLTGSVRKIADARAKLNDGSFVPEFFLNPEHEQMTKPGEYALDVAGFARRSDKIRRLGLTVDLAEPNAVTVTVVALEKKTLVVRCVDENQNIIAGATSEPPTIDAPVPADRGGGALVAKVRLSRREIEQARLSPIEKTPYVELAPNHIRQALVTVKISTPKEPDRLQEYTITNVRLGFSLSATLQGRYGVKLTNPDVVMGPVTIKATPQARRAYENMRYHVILEIDDSDRDTTKTDLRRELVYNFPQEFVRKDEIRLSKPPAQARFRIEPAAAQPTRTGPAVTE